MEHCVAGDGIHLTVGPTVSRYVTGEVRLLVQDIIPLQHHSKLLPFQESMRELHVPYKLIGVQRLVVITSFTEHIDIG